MGRAQLDHDSALAERVFKGDVDAENAIVQKFSPGVFRILQRRTLDDSLAEDLTQETFIVLIQRLRNSRLEDSSKLSHFIHRVAVNLITGENRKLARRATTPDSPVIDQVASHDMGPPQILSKERRAFAVRKLLEELRMPRDRAILMQYFVEERDKSQVCLSLNLSAAHFDRVLLRAKQRFALLIKESGQFRDDS